MSGVEFAANIAEIWQFKLSFTIVTDKKFEKVHSFTVKLNTYEKLNRNIMSMSNRF